MCVDTSCITATSSASDATTGDVNTMVPGTYTITYSATDPSGNVATTETRTVTIADTMAPVIVLSHPDTADANVYPVGTEKAFHHVEGSTSGTTANSKTDWGTQTSPMATDSTGRAATTIPSAIDATWMPKDSFMAEST